MLSQHHPDIVRQRLILQSICHPVFPLIRAVLSVDQSLEPGAAGMDAGK
jgi:hypothetical protein